MDTDDGPKDLLASVPETGTHSDPQRRMLSQELRDRIESVLLELTPRERAVFEMRHNQGMRLRAIGEVLGTTEEAAKNCLFRATQKMRAGLGEFV
jgi:RNA polymerase sigma-70 factor (ECF subfamily)